ncbi:lysostaphin resistance A-like protein [Terriglobus sp. RCC_193]|uniref:CPBP family intramembrane glutamic endopeptidase n=1 Tax=Terriglobus sp. RCC_193 TaxID=3239218 RepID=UPI003525C0F9
MQDNQNPDVPPRHGVQRIFFGHDGLRAVWSILLFLVLAFALGRAIFAVLGGYLHQQQLVIKSTGELPVTFTLLMDSVLFAVAALVAFLISRIEKRNFGQYGIDALRPHRIRQFAVGAVFGVATMCLLMLALKVAGVMTFNGLLLHGTDIVKWGALWALAFFAVALAEEYLMRGFLQFQLARGVAAIAARMGHREALCKRIGFWVAAGFFSLLFGLLHGNNPGESPIGLVSAGLVGLVFAYSLWRTGSLWWAIGYHAAWDWTQSFVWGVADSGGVSQHRLLLTHSQGPLLLSGGLTGPEGSVLVLAVILLVTAIVALTLKAEPGSPAAESNVSSL